MASVGEAETNATYSRYLVSSSETKHHYVTQNGKVVRETIIKGGVTRVLDYIYDESGRPSSVIFKDGTADEVTYYYVLNLQGDVEKIIDANGVVQAIYSYDPWGKILSITSGTGASVNDTHIAKLNGLRYRGYHGDNETQWYYLQSRYYDPFTHRFVNADSYTSTGTGILGTNMFAYCNNNPIAYRDDSGHAIFPTTTVDAGRGDAGFSLTCESGYSYELYEHFKETVLFELESEFEVNRIAFYGLTEMAKERNRPFKAVVLGAKACNMLFNKQPFKVLINLALRGMDNLADAILPKIYQGYEIVVEWEKPVYTGNGNWSYLSIETTYRYSKQGSNWMLEEYYDSNGYWIS